MNAFELQAETFESYLNNFWSCDGSVHSDNEKDNQVQGYRNETYPVDHRSVNCVTI